MCCGDKNSFKGCNVKKEIFSVMRNRPLNDSSSFDKEKNNISLIDCRVQLAWGELKFPFFSISRILLRGKVVPQVTGNR